MKSMRFCATLILSAMTAASVRLAAQGTPPPSAVAPSAPVSAASGPMIQFDNPLYEFGRVPVGEKVHHTYFVTNTGNETLQITNVHPGCHCTTAGDWTHNIEPGKTGEIPVQFDSSGLSGTLTRSIEVFSNAKNGPHKSLQLKGTIWKPIEYASTAVITVPADATNEISTKVRIVNQTENMVTFSNVSSAKSLFTGALTETTPGKEYELVITAHPPFPTANTSGPITINTSLPGTPIISVTAMVNITPAIQVAPSQFVLNPSPDRATTNRVSILANTTNLLTLSNAKSSESELEVEVQPGPRKGMFNVVLTAPAGFHLAPGQRAEVTVESNHPRYPVIKIPIKQYTSPRPVKPVAALPAQPNSPPATSHP
jgi:hypothetical protein